jgi:hypothetical protein
LQDYFYYYSTSCGHVMDIVTPEAGFELRVEDEEKKVTAE